MITTSKASVSFLGRTLPAAKREHFHGFAFLPKAAKQEIPEEISPSPFSGDDSGIQHERVVPS
jgi:hypothetical protein